MMPPTQSSPQYRILKRCLDILGAGAGLLAAAPILIAASAAVWLDSGRPVIFRQSRLGRNGVEFHILKLRTMHVGSAVAVNETGSVANSPDDSRHTRVGRLLRRYSVDELPQLLNVVLGDMSLVGPRPDLPVALNYYSEEQRIKLAVKPGISGLAQVSGRNALSPSDRWNLDAQYASAPSLALDLRILVRTALAVLPGRGVYD